MGFDKPRDEPDQDEYDRREAGMDDDDEPCGTCDQCEGNLYPDDTYFDVDFQYCGQCYWLLTDGTGQFSEEETQ